MREVVRELLERSDVRMDIRDKDGRTARDVAVEEGNREIVKMIDKREAGSDGGGAGSSEDSSNNGQG